MVVPGFVTLFATTRLVGLFLPVGKCGVVGGECRSQHWVADQDWSNAYGGYVFLAVRVSSARSASVSLTVDSTWSGATLTRLLGFHAYSQSQFHTYESGVPGSTPHGAASVSHLLVESVPLAVGIGSYAYSQSEFLRLSGYHARLVGSAPQSGSVPPTVRSQFRTYSQGSVPAPARHQLVSL